MNCKIDFDEAAHTYSVNGRPMPSVTTVMREAGILQPLPVDDATLEFALARGRALHRAVELDDAGQLDEATVDPSIVGRLEAYRRFRADTLFRPEHSEVRLAHSAYQYAGTADLVGFVGGERAIIDIKAAPRFEPSTAVQTEAYRQAFFFTFSVKALRTYSLNLRDDGTYRLTRLDERYPTAGEIFLAALSIYHWRAAHVR